MDTSTSLTLISVAIAGLGLILTVVGTLSGFAYKTLHNRITEVKDDALKAVEAEERRRTEAYGQILAQINSQYAHIMSEMNMIREDIKDVRNDAVA